MFIKLNVFEKLWKNALPFRHQMELLSGNAFFIDFKQIGKFLFL